MKPIATLTLGWALMASPLAEAQEASAKPLPKMIRVQVEFIDVPHETLTALMADETITNDTQLRARLTELVKKKEASIMETQILQAPDGQKATAESIEEYIYPTEYEPAELPNEITVEGEDGAQKVNTRDFATGPTPTAFETRNLGTTLEIEPTLQKDGRTVMLRFAPEIVHHVKNEVWSEWEGVHGRSDITMPVMFSMRVSTGVYVADGDYRLVSATSPKGEEGYPDFDRKVMLFVRCDVREAGK